MYASTAFLTGRYAVVFTTVLAGPHNTVLPAAQQARPGGRLVRAWRRKKEGSTKAGITIPACNNDYYRKVNLSFHDLRVNSPSPAPHLCAFWFTTRSLRRHGCMVSSSAPHSWITFRIYGLRTFTIHCIGILQSVIYIWKNEGIQMRVAELLL